jgi:DNA polymerase-3 subunit epsilon
MSWLDNRALAFDFETTGLNPETARIVTAAVITRGGGNNPGFHDARTWLSDVDGAEIPTAASDIHKVTTAKAHADGDPAAEVVEDIAATLHQALAEGTPVVAMNARFDFTILDRECRRYGLATLEQRLGREVGPVIDTYILDKQVDMFRRGSRKLEALARHYSVTLVDAHTADADARAAVEVAVAIAQRYRHLQVDADLLHSWQVQWAAQQAVSLEEYKRRTDRTAVVEGAWPVVPYKAPAPEPAAQLGEMCRIVTSHVAQALATGDFTAWRLAVDLAKELDGAGLNVDRAVDQELQRQGIDARAAWVVPAEIVEDGAR